MGTEGVQAKLATVETIGRATQSFARQAGESAERALALAGQFEQQVCREHQRRVEVLKRAKRAREATASALRVCTENCGALHEALAKAEIAEAEAIKQADLSAKAVAQVGEALGGFRSAVRTFDAALQYHAPRAAHNTKQVLSQMQQIVGAGRESTSGSLGANGGTNDPISQSATVRGMEDIEIQRVINDRSSPLNFEKASRAHVEWGLDKLKTVVEPALRMGKGPDYFAKRDKDERLSGERSYSGVYNWFYNSDHAIKLTRASGGYVVSNGYHRLAVARELGLETLPALVR